MINDQPYIPYLWKGKVTFNNRNDSYDASNKSGKNTPLVQNILYTFAYLQGTTEKFNKGVNTF